MDPNSHEALLQRREAATLTWRGPVRMLFAHAACAGGAQEEALASLDCVRRTPQLTRNPLGRCDTDCAF